MICFNFMERMKATETSVCTCDNNGTYGKCKIWYKDYNTNGPRVQMQTAGSKKKEDWTEVSKEQLAEVKLPASFEKLKEQKSYFYHGENISDYELVQTAVALGKMELPTDEKKCIPDRAAMDAFEVLVRDQASGLTLTFLY